MIDMSFTYVIRLEEDKEDKDKEAGRR